MLWVPRSVWNSEETQGLVTHTSRRRDQNGEDSDWPVFKSAASHSRRRSHLVVSYRFWGGILDVAAPCGARDSAPDRATLVAGALDQPPRLVGQSTAVWFGEMAPKVRPMPRERQDFLARQKIRVQ